MIIVDHRRNTLDSLRATPPAYGIEVDLRNHGNDIVVFHDPFHADAIWFEEWLQDYRHRFLIANVKEEGLEPVILPLLEKYNIGEYFILDESLPYIRKYGLSGLSKFAVRVSEIESVDTALNLVDHLSEKGKRIDWVWLDSFTGSPLQQDVLSKLKNAGLKLCQVSPELHHVDNPAIWSELVERFMARLEHIDTELDMVCTKLPDVWRQFSLQREN